LASRIGDAVRSRRTWGWIGLAFLGLAVLRFLFGSGVLNR